MTPVHRWNEYRKDIFENEINMQKIASLKVSSGQWKREHPELNDILKKRIKRGKLNYESY